MKPTVYHINTLIAGIMFVLAGAIGASASMAQPSMAQPSMDTEAPMDQAMDGPERFVLEQINQYRAAPYTHAVALGYDVLALAEIGITPETGFAPFEMDDSLNAVATNANVLAGASADETIPVPAPDRQQVIQTGSVLTFSHFIPVETAGTLFVQNLFQNELNTGEFQFILSTAFTGAGVALDPGVLDGRNCWFSSLVLGSAARVADIQILNLINQVRAEPYLVPRTVSTGFLDRFRHNEQLYHLPGMRFQPVFFSQLLYEHARADVLEPEALEPEALEPGILEPDVPDTGVHMAETFGEEVIQAPENTYPGGFFDIATASVFWPDLADAQVITDLFSALLVDEFATWPYGAILFSNYYNEAGVFVSVDAGEQVDNPDTWKPPIRTGIGTVSFFSGPGIPSMPDPEALPPDGETVTARIYGVLFTDHDGDDIYAAGDEVSGEIVTVYDVHRNWVTSVASDNAGHFSMTLTPGDYWFEAWHEGRFIQRFVHVESHQFLKIGFHPIPAPPPSILP